MSGAPLSASAPNFATSKEPSWRFVLHLPPAIFLLSVGTMAGLVGPGMVRAASGVADVWLRLGFGIRLVGLAAILLAYGSGWRAPGPWWVRGFSWLVLGVAWLAGGASFLLGGAAPPELVDATLGAAFAAAPLYLRRARLTEAWVHGSLRPLLWIALTGLAPFAAVLLSFGYEAWLRAEAPAMVERLDALTEGLRQLSARGSLSAEESQALLKQARALPSADRLWLLIAATPPDGTNARKRRGPVEESASALLLAAQGLFSPQNERKASLGPWEISGAPDAPGNQNHFARAASYWRTLASLTTEGALFAPFLDERTPYGLDPNPKLRPAPEDTIGRIALFRGEGALRVAALQREVASMRGEVTHTAELQAARAALAPYPVLSAALPKEAPDRAQVESWGALTLLGTPLLDPWGQLALSDANRLVNEARCFKDKSLERNGKKLVPYSCPGYDLSQKEPLGALVVRVLVLAPVSGGAAEEVWLEVERPKNIPSWKSEFVAALKRRGMGVSQVSAGFTLAPPDGEEAKPALSLQFVERGERIQARFTRQTTPPKKK